MLPAFWTNRGVGEEVREAAIHWGASLRVKQGKTPAGMVFSTRSIYLERGNHRASFRYLIDLETHVSPFDAHPNPQTHRIMAAALCRQLTKIPLRLTSP